MWASRLDHDHHAEPWFTTVVVTWTAPVSSTHSAQLGSQLVSVVRHRWCAPSIHGVSNYPTSDLEYGKWMKMWIGPGIRCDTLMNHCGRSQSWRHTSRDVLRLKPLLSDCTARQEETIDGSVRAKSRNASLKLFAKYKRPAHAVYPRVYRGALEVSTMGYAACVARDGPGHILTQM